MEGASGEASVILPIRPGARTPRAPRRRRRLAISGWIGIVLAFFASALIVVSAIDVFGSGPRDLRGLPVHFDPGALPTRSEVQQMHVTSTGGRLTVPAVGLNVPLDAMNAVGGKVDPPKFTAAYWIRNMGVSPAEADSGTVYVAMHSLRNGAVGPGNYLIDVGNQTARVHNGDKVGLDGVSYTVSGFEVIPKSEIGRRTDLWSRTPGQLVLITCLQNGHNTPSKNVIVITAKRSQ